MRTPIFEDSEGNEVPREVLAKLAKISSFRSRGMLRSLPEDVIREGEDARVVFVRGIYYRREAMEAQIAEGALEFSLCPEPDNAVDSNAVAIHLNGEKIGYIAKELAPLLQSLVIEGACRVAAATRPVRDGDNYTVALLLAWNCEPAMATA
jgi:hypothetical protein